jgi:carbon monoxide dehydrogenase subunit G
MRIAGENVLHAPVERAWDALLDPAVLVATIPGCERLVATGENSYDMTVTAGVAAIKGTYAGTCVLSDLTEPASLVMKLDGAGAPGTIGATVNVAFASAEGGTTRVTWDADAFGFTIADCDRELRAGEPRIEVLTNSNPSFVAAAHEGMQAGRKQTERRPDRLQIISMTMKDGEELIVGRRLRDILTQARRKVKA